MIIIGLLGIIGAMKYCLENTNEAQRLEKQSTYSQYDCAQELRSLDFNPCDVVLDAGCGTGPLSRYLATEVGAREVHGRDMSQERVEQARLFSKGIENLHFSQADIYNIKSLQNYYDKAISRYVFQHLNDPIAAAKELYRVLRPGGQVIIIDTDGVSFDLYSENEELVEMMELVKKRFCVDVYMGRKLPSILAKAGFSNIDWEILPMNFKGQDLEAEYEITRERFDFALEHFSEILGSNEQALRFKDLYLSEMLKENNVLFYNKFIVTANK